MTYLIELTANCCHLINTSDVVSGPDVVHVALREWLDLSQVEAEVVGPLKEEFESGLKLVALLEQRTAAKHVKAESSTRHRNHQSSHVAKMTHKSRSHQ